MSRYKFKYIIVRAIPYIIGEAFAVVDVGHLNKKGREAEWDRLDEEYPKDQYRSCFTQCNEEMRTFEITHVDFENE